MGAGAFFGIMAIAALLVLGACAPADDEELTAPLATSTPGPTATPFPDAIDFAMSLRTGVAEVGAGRADLRLVDIIGGGRPVIVNFYGATCPPCLREMPIFQQVYAERSGEFLMPGVDLTDVADFGSPEQAQELVEMTGVQYPLASVPHANLIVKYGLNKAPSTLFITGDGKLKRKVLGPVDLEEFDGMVQELINTR